MFLELLIGISSVLLFLFLSVNSERFRLNLPPEPLALPILGHLHLISQKQPHESIKRLKKKFGDIFALRLGSHYTVVVNSPEMIKETLVTQGNVFSDRYRYTFHYQFPEFTQNIADSNGKVWRQNRKIFVHGLMKHMSRNEDLITTRVKSFLNDVKSSKQPFDVRLLLKNMSLDIIFHLCIDCSDCVAEAFKSRVIANIEGFNNLFSAFDAVNYFPLLALIPSKTNQKMRKLFNEFIALVKEIIDWRSETFDNKNPRDFLDSLLVQKESIGEVAIAMIFAGADTTSTTIEWMIALLVNRPEIQKKVFLELDSVLEGGLARMEDMEHLPYLQAVVKETLRFRPVAPLLVPHCTSEDATVNGFHIPKGSQVLVDNWGISSSEEYWKDPLVFRPERFLEEEASLRILGAEKREVSENKFIPFGTGRRACAGIELAKMELFLQSAAVFYAFEWCAEGGVISIEPEVSFLLKPKPFEVTAKERREGFVLKLNGGD